MVGAVISINYELNRKFLREEINKLLNMGIPQSDVYRGVGMVLGLLGKMHSFSGNLRTYIDNEGYAYMIAESYSKFGDMHMVKVKEDDWKCTCERFHKRMMENAVTVCKEKHEESKAKLLNDMLIVRGICKHVVAVMILRDYFGW